MRARCVLALTGLLLAGCTTFGGSVPAWIESQQVDPALEPVSALAFLDRLARASAAELQAMSARRPAGPEDPRAALRHAFWLATRGHPGYNPAAARETLEALLAMDRRLDAPTRALVRVQLRHLQARREWLENNQRLAHENQHLRRQIQALTALERRMNGNTAPSGGDAP